MIQSLQQIVSLSVRNGSRRLPVEVNIGRARDLYVESVSGERSEKMSIQARQMASDVSHVVQEQLGVSMGQVMSPEFSSILADLVDEMPQGSYHFLEALLVMSGRPVVFLVSK